MTDVMKGVRMGADRDRGGDDMTAFWCRAGSAASCQFDEKPTGTARAPEFNEHGDEILAELGLDMDRILELEAAGAVT